jgi:DNA-binding CsgD family transcriptional regulator
VLIGREDELEAIGRFLEEAVAPSALEIAGEPGIGKTTLWHAGVARAETLDRRVIRARPVRAAADMAFAGLETLIGDALEEIADELLPARRIALEVALLRAEPGPRELEAMAVASATLSALQALSARQPLLIAIDDFQWLDDATLRTLTVALSRLTDEDVLLLASRRERAETPDLGLDRGRVNVMKIGGLDVQALRSLVRERLGHSLSLPAARRLHELSGGNPFYALELAREDDIEAKAPLDVRGLVGQRLAALPAATQVALGVLAAAARPDLVSALVADESAFEPALVAGVLEQDGAELCFAHPLLAAGAYRALSPARRRELHSQLAERAADPEERARHLAAATPQPDARAAEIVEGGAVAAAARGAPSIAADLFEGAARLTPGSDLAAATHRRLEAARQLFAAGDGLIALKRCQALVDELPAGDLRADVLTTMAWRGKMPIEDGRAVCEQAVAECKTVPARARCLLLLSNVVQTNDVERALLLAREALDLLEDDDPSLRAWAMGSLGAYDVFTHPGGFGLGLLRQASALEREHGSSAPDIYLEASSMLAIALYLHDELDDARELFKGQRAKALRAGQEAGVAGVTLHLAELEIKAGNLERARAYADEALAIEDDGEDSQPLGSLLFARAKVAELQGDGALATKLAQRGLEVGRAVGDGIFPVLNRWVLGSLALTRGDAEAAISELEPLPGAWRELGFIEPGSALFTSDCIDALIAGGRIDQAEEANTAWEELGRKLDRPRLLATGARARGVIAAARGDIKQALAALEQALEHHERLPVPHERARTLLALGVTLRRAGHRRDAREMLDQALAVFEALGEPLWAQRVREEGGRIAGRKPAGAEELTSTERRIAELVAEGRANREVADTLFITVRTVEANLTRIYRKLSIRSRGQLAAVWNARAAQAAAHRNPGSVG